MGQRIYPKHKCYEYYDDGLHYGGAENNEKDGIEVRASTDGSYVGFQESRILLNGRGINSIIFASSVGKIKKIRINASSISLLTGSAFTGLYGATCTSGSDYVEWTGSSRTEVEISVMSESFAEIEGITSIEFTIDNPLIVWDNDFIQNIKLEYLQWDMTDIDVAENNEKDGIKILARDEGMGNCIYFRSGYMSLADDTDFTFYSSVGKIKKIRIYYSWISAGHGELYFNWTVYPDYVEWIGTSSTEVEMFYSGETNSDDFSLHVSSIEFTMDDGSETETKTISGIPYDWKVNNQAATAACL